MPEEPVKIEVKRREEELFEIIITTDIRLECGYCELIVDDTSYGQNPFYTDYVLSLGVGKHSFTVIHWDIVDKPYVIQRISGSFELTSDGEIILSDDIFPLGKLKNQRTILIADFPIQPCYVRIESVPTALDVYQGEQYIGITPCGILAHYHEPHGVTLDREPVPFSLEWNRESRKWGIDEVLGIFDDWDTKDENNKGLTLILTMPSHRGKVVIEESKIPTEIYLGIPSTFSFSIYNIGKMSSSYNLWVKFLGIDVSKEYYFFYEDSDEALPGESTKIDVEVVLPEDAIAPDKDEAIYEIKVILEAK